MAVGLLGTGVLLESMGIDGFRVDLAVRSEMIEVDK